MSCRSPGMFKRRLEADRTKQPCNDLGLGATYRPKSQLAQLSIRLCYLLLLPVIVVIVVAVVLWS